MALSIPPATAAGCAWCDLDAEAMQQQACFNSRDLCIDCCVSAGDPCGHARGDADLPNPPLTLVQVLHDLASRLPHQAEEATSA